MLFKSSSVLQGMPIGGNVGAPLNAHDPQVKSLGVGQVALPYLSMKRPSQKNIRHPTKYVSMGTTVVIRGE